MKENGRIVQWWTVPGDDGGELELRHVEILPRINTAGAKRRAIKTIKGDMDKGAALNL